MLLRLFIIFIILFGVCSFFEKAEAYTHILSAELAQEVLSESVPTAIAPAPFDSTDFELVWIDSPVDNVEFSLGQASLEWVRVSDLLVLPRARLLLQAKNIESGLLKNMGFSQNFEIKNSIGRAELPIALISTEKNPIEVIIKRNGKEITGKIQARFHPKNQTAPPPVFTDASCSPFGVRAEVKNFSQDSWMVLGCRLVYVEGAEYKTSSLEMFIFWDNVGQEIEISGVKTRSTSTSVWPLRLRSSPGNVHLKKENMEVTLHYFIPEKLRRGFLGLGMGPYQYVFESFDASVNSVVPLMTLYGSFFVTETMRLVAFDATAAHKKFFTDFGVYLSNEYIKTLDRRFILNIMLGAHVIGFSAENKTNFIIGAPQGVEMIFKDAFCKGYNFAAGAFIYPPIQRKLYYNLWLRWGSGRLFGEVNYIAWQEVLEKDRAYSRSLGITFGFPLFRFF